MTFKEIEEIRNVLIIEGQNNASKYGFHLGDTIKFSPTQVEEIIKESTKTITESEIEEIKKIGRKEAWEAADKLNRMSIDEIREIFDDDPLCVSVCRGNLFCCCTPELAIKKIREYEEKQKIQVGDEVYYHDPTNARVVTRVLEIDGITKAVQFTSNGRCVVDDIRDLHKTGRHFDEIENVLKNLKGKISI